MISSSDSWLGVGSEGERQVEGKERGGRGELTGTTRSLPSIGTQPARASGFVTIRPRRPCGPAGVGATWGSNAAGQSQVSASSCEAEYYAYCVAVKNIKYVSLLFCDLLLLMTLLLLPCMKIVSQLLPCFRALLTVLAQRIFTWLWPCVVITSCLGCWACPLEALSWLLIFLPSSLVLAFFCCRGLALWVLFLPYICNWCVVAFNYVLQLMHCRGALSCRMVVGSVRSSLQLLDVMIWSESNVLPPRLGQYLSHHGRIMVSIRNQFFFNSEKGSVHPSKFILDFSLLS
jgi:hypothetical protein